jgi:hypothetical protein
VQPRTVTAALGRLNMGSGQVRLPPVSAPAANAQAAANAQGAAKVASAASSEQEEVGDMMGCKGWASKEQSSPWTWALDAVTWM